MGAITQDNNNNSLKWLLWLFIACLGYFLLNGCTASHYQRKCAQLCQKYPVLCDTQIVVKVDTFEYFTSDTIFTRDSVWLVEQRGVLDSLFKMSRVDTFVVTKRGVTTIVYRDNDNFRVVVDQLDSTLEVYEQKLIENSRLREIIRNQETKVSTLLVEKKSIKKRLNEVLTMFGVLVLIGSVFMFLRMLKE